MKLSRKLHRSHAVFAVIICILTIISCSEEQALIEESEPTTPPTDTKTPTAPAPTTPAIVVLKPYTFTETPFSSADFLNPGKRGRTMA